MEPEVPFPSDEDIPQDDIFLDDTPVETQLVRNVYKNDSTQDVFSDGNFNKVEYNPQELVELDYDEETEFDWSAEVVATARECIAAHNGQPGGQLLEMLDYILSTPLAIDRVSKKTVTIWTRARQVAAAVWSDFPDDPVDFNDVAGVEYASKDVRTEYVTFASLAKTPGLPVNPTATWRALAERLQRVASKQSALDLIELLDTDRPDEEVMEVFRAFTPPSAQTSVRNQVFAQTALQWEASDRAAAAEAPSYRLSSGYPSFDLVMTKKTASGADAEPFGAFEPGSFTVIAAPTGNGKSSLARRLVPAMAQDLRNWGRPNDKVLLCITEESPDVVYNAAGLASGQALHHLADQVVIARVAASRVRIVHSVWDRVIEAFHTSRKNGMPISFSGLPAAIVWDYIGGTYEANESIDTTGMERNANLAKAFMEWDVTSMEMFSGESFASYAGMPWPSGMEYFRPVVIAFAQFKKLADPLWYDPDNRSCHLSDFVEDRADGSPAWEVRKGDFRVPRQAEVRGSGILINHATTLLIAMRSRPQRNPASRDPATGEFHLEDTRARLLLVKTRTGSDASVVPLAFDVQANGKRAQFFDAKAEMAIRLNKLTPGPGYVDPGDPIMPVRPHVSPLASVGY